MDSLSELFERIQLKGKLFFSGKIDETLNIDRPIGTAFLHILEEGGIDLVRPGFPDISIDEPSLLLCPGSCRYKLRASSPSAPPPIICASFEFGALLGKALPFGVTDTIVFPFSQIASIAPVLQILLLEFQGTGPGRLKGINALFEYILILLVRQSIEKNAISKGILFSMLDPQIGRAIKEIHFRPEEPWTVDQLAALSNMSRSKFATRFTTLVGVPPIGYLSSWRIKMAQDLIRSGVALKVVAAATGFSSQPTFTRAFSKEIGLSPGEWLKRS